MGSYIYMIGLIVIGNILYKLHLLFVYLRFYISARRLNLIGFGLGYNTKPLIHKSRI